MRRATRGGALFVASLLAGVCIGWHRPSAAADAADGAPAWLQEVTFNGFLSTSYSYNFNRPASGANQFRVFDFDDNTFKLDEFELVAQKAVAKPHDSGFRVDLTLGGSVPRVTAAAGLFRDESGKAEDIDVHQAFASFVAPLGSGLRFDVGKFITSPGYEVIDGYDGWNDNATRSLLFGYAIPFTHVGARASYAATSGVSGTVMVVNGWDVARDNNRSKSVGAQMALNQAPLTFSLSWMYGPERAGNDSDPRTLFDAVAILKAQDRLTLGVNLDWGTDKNGAGSARNRSDARWTGIAGYARISATRALALSLRVESFEDRAGVRTGVVQTLSEFTATPEYRFTPHLLVRGDVRVDRSDRPVFEKSQALTKTQPTVLLNACYSF